MRLKRRPTILVVVAAGVALLASGCTNSPGKTALRAASTTTTPVATSSTTVPANASTTITASTSSTVPASTSTTVVQCTASDLQPSWSGMGDGASETVYFVVNLVNSSSAPCETGGYVGVSAYDPAGDLIPASESRQLLGTNSAAALTMTPGGTVHFIVGFADTDMADGGYLCSTTVGALHLIPPDETTEVQVATPVRSHFPALCGRTFQVGPLISGAASSGE